MSNKTEQTELPPILTLLLNKPAGELYSLTTKTNVTDGVKECDKPAITGVSRDDSKGLVSLNFGRHLTTFRLEGDRLKFFCSCQKSYDKSLCQHVVTGWACLKRLVSPTSLTFIRFSQHNLDVVSRLLNPEAPATENHETSLLKKLARSSGILASNSSLKKQPVVDNATTAEPDSFKLLIYINYGGDISCSIYRGNERVTPWGSRNIPPDIHTFIIRHQLLNDLDKSYLDSFSKLSKRGIPIYFQDDTGKETALAYHPQKSFRASLRFELDGEQIKIMPGIDGGSPLPENFDFTDDLLIDFDNASIHPLSNSDIWDLCSELDPGDQWQNPDYDPDDDFDDDYNDDNDGYEKPYIAEGATFTAEWFNKSGFMLMGNSAGDPPLKDIYLFHNSSPVEPVETTAAYRLLVSETGDKGSKLLIPQAICADVEMPFSARTFGFLGDRSYPGFSGGLRTKNRSRIIIETALSLAASPPGQDVQKLIRNTVSAVDFPKRELREKAKNFFLQFAAICRQTGMILTAHPDGWHVTWEDRQYQAALLSILFDIYGPEPFTDHIYPGVISLQPTEFHRRQH